MNSFLSIFALLVLTENILVSAFVHPPPIPKGTLLPPEQWFEQKLDHFNPTEIRTWKQRFFVNDTFYRAGGPAFLMIGGEGPASANWMVTGSWTESAKEFNAYMVQLEHRFYGDSHPTKDVSTKNLVYLSSEQALADLAYFVSSMNETLSIEKWIAMGGSYPGSLATWVRLKYPHIIYASVATSAPLLAQVDFKEYLEVVDESIAFYGGHECNANIRKAIVRIEFLLQHRIGWSLLNKKFSLCSPLDATKPLDVSNFFELLTENFNDVVQYNKDNRAFEGVKTADITIDTLCGIMNNASINHQIDRLAQVNSLMLWANDKKCLDHTYLSLVDSLTNFKWNRNTDVGGRQWTYQTCTEFGFYQDSDSPNQPFGNHFPLDFYVNQCKDVFGSMYNAALLSEGVKRSNIIYGGKNPQVSRVLFVNGSIDPWHKLGVVKDLNEDSPAVFINGTAHCANMYPASDSDLPELTAARNTIRKTIQGWLQNQN